MKQLKMLVAVAVAVGTFLLGGWLLRRGMTAMAPRQVEAPVVPGGTRLFNSVVQTIRAYAVDSLDESTVYRLAAAGMLSELGDPYASLIADRDTAGRAIQAGAPPVQGLYLDWIDELVGVVTVVPGSPAAAAGVRAGDIILRVGETPITRERPDDVARMVDGKDGSSVRIRLGREVAAAALWVTLERGPVPEPPPAELAPLGPGQMVLRAFRVDSAAVTALARALGELPESGGSLVLDFRGAVGGSLSEAVAFADLLLGDGQTIVTVRGRPAVESNALVDRTEPAKPDLAVVVLVDRGTAGAAEVVAGALQDHDRAAIVGETTFGRGGRLSFFPLGNGTSVQLLTEVWETPSGRVIQRFAAAPAPDGIDTLPDRPKFRTDGGRTVLGGGGVVPDREIEAEAEPSRTADSALEEARRLLARAANRKALIAALSAN